jgi:hypothetical protein
MAKAVGADAGGFVKAVLKVFDIDHKKTEDTIEVCFNPKEYQLQRQVQYSPAEANADSKQLQHTNSNPMTLTLTLYFDTFESNGTASRSVREAYTKKIENLTMMRDLSPDQKKAGKNPSPPLVIFCWGKNIFQGVIQSLTTKYTMFLKDGTPVRAECNLTIEHADNANRDAANDVNRGGSPGAQSSRQANAQQVKETGAAAMGTDQDDAMRLAAGRGQPVLTADMRGTAVPGASPAVFDVNHDGTQAGDRGFFRRSVATVQETVKDARDHVTSVTGAMSEQVQGLTGGLISPTGVTVADENRRSGIRSPGWQT